MTYGSAIPTGVSVCIGSEVFNLVEKKGTNIKTSCACRALGAGALTVLPVELENWEPEKIHQRMNAVHGRSFDHL